MKLEQELQFRLAGHRRREFELVDRVLLESSIGLRAALRLGRNGGVTLRSSAPPFRMQLYGTSVGFVSLDFDDNTQGAYKITAPGLLASLRSLFDRSWQVAGRVDLDERPATDVLDVLAQLVSGATDETAARRLQVSVRTYRRRVTELMDMLNVRSRFEAGVVATQRGYIDMLPGARFRRDGD